MPLPRARPAPRWAEIPTAATNNRVTASRTTSSRVIRTVTAVLTDPFGFGFGFGGYQQGYGQQGASYSGSDSPEMQAARNFVANGRYAEARRVLDGMTGRNARWYYLSSLANQGLGNRIDALQDARRAVQLDPGNTEYQMHLRRMQNPGQTYRTTQATYTSPGGLMQWCWSMILLNLLCNCCCGGWGFHFRM